ncbi:MAG TPA: UDP-N-acetylglucosamine--N-acetylmuramyl-(pentapeptide) pyrophosphoryl-undecaprenol N-acetylglucosamine transferase, partial [Alphaproteobacteria bacterium]
YPALTIARALRAKNYRVLLCTDKRGVRFVENTDISYRVVQSAPMRKGLIGKISTLLLLGIGYLQSHILFLFDKPAVIVGLGGYPSFPPVIAAAHRQIPVVLHEQNALFGRAQRMLHAYAKKICLSFPQTKMLQGIPEEKLQVTGLPLRPEIMAISDHPYTLPQGDEKLRILITGGSLASALFGDTIPLAMAQLAPELQDKIHVVQQCRAEQAEMIRQFYTHHRISSDVQTYLHDMPDQLRLAHLFIGRAGASTVTEMAVAGLPAIFIPLAVSLDGDQAANAEHIVKAGGGWILPEKDFSPESLAAMLSDIINQPTQLISMASTMKTLGRADATERLTQTIIEAMA